MGLFDAAAQLATGGVYGTGMAGYRAAQGDWERAKSNQLNTMTAGLSAGAKSAEIAPAPLPGSEDEKQRQSERLAGRQRAAQALVEAYKARPEQMAITNRQVAARALAAGLSQGGITGGASLAAAQQSALDLEGKQADELAQAEINAAQAEYEQFLDENDPGSESKMKKQKMNEYDSKVQTIIERYKGTFNDDEDSMAREINALADREEDPEIAEWLRKQANDIQSGEWDV